MSTQRRSVLKNWFRNGLTPTQSQFADAFDSFFHKSEDMIPLDHVEGLLAELETKKAELQDYLNERLRSAIDDLDGRVNDNSDTTVSNIDFGVEDDELWMELTMLSGETSRVPLSIPLATEDHDGLMSASDKYKLNRLSDSFIDVAEYMEEGAELPANGVYLYEGYPVDSRIYSRSYGDTYWLAFCLKKGDTDDDDFGIGVKDCLVYSADSRNGVFSFVGRYYEDDVPSHVQEAFGYKLASSDNAGLMSAADKEKLDNIDEELEGIKLSDKAHHHSRFGAIVEGNITFEQVGLHIVPSGAMVVWCKDMNCFALRRSVSGNVKYYNAWFTQDEYTDLETGLPYTDKQYVCGKKLYMYNSDEGKLVEVGGSGTSGIFNVTNAVPINGYYVLFDQQNTGISAVHAAWNSEKAVSGLIISFEISAGIWKTYQYIGRTLTEQNWLNTDNWKDFGSLAAGSETYLIINNLCGAPIAGTYYTLETAVARLVAWQQTSGVTYAKKGLIISYQTGENTLETKQFQGEVTDFGEVGLWKDFGGGSDVEVTGEPEENSDKVLSAGGAYECIPTGIKVDTETEGVVKMQLENAAGDGIGDEVQLSVGTGGGGSSSGTIVTAAFQMSPMYGNAGGSFIIRAAVRSVTTVGSSEQENTIATIALYDRDTNTLLETFLFNKASSVSLSTYDFVMDVSQYFAAAGVRRFRCLITDDGGNTGSRNINVTAVDVTVSSVQTLQYTQSTALTVGGGAKSIPLYKFANNASDRGITAITEIFLNGSWQQLGSSVIQDTYSHGITIDPTNCLGVSLSHGAYPIRVHGVDVASGVVGNYLYTGIFVIYNRENDLCNFSKPNVQKS